MEPPPSAPSATPPLGSTTSPRPPIPPSKLRLMCSYGGHIVPRPHDKSLFYAGGETRIVGVDRRTTAASLSSLSSHLSRAIFHNRPFYLKYLLPDEDLDSLISVVTDEDLSNMLDEHDRITPPARIRLFLFPVNPESVGSALLDPKSESWFCDALKNTRILQKGQSADSGLLLGIGLDLEGAVESGSNSGGGGEGKLGPESLVLETNSSFGSTSSSLSTSNSPHIAIAHSDEKGLNLIERKIRVPSSASIDSDYSVGSLAAPPQAGSFLEPLIHVGPEESSETTVLDSLLNTSASKRVQVLGYPLSQLEDGMKQQHETQLIQGGLHYVPQYASPMPIPPYYPVYQMPMHPQHISCPPNQPYPVYLMPIRPTQYHNMSMQFNSFEANATNALSRPPLHPQSAAVTQPMAYKEVFGAQVAESATKVYGSIPAATQIVSAPSNQGQMIKEPPEPQIVSEPIPSSAVVSNIQANEFDEDIAYNQIYKTQPSLPILSSQYQTMSKGTTVLPEPSVQLLPNHAKQQAALHPQ